ncbi:cupin domain-containing protein [Streptomyces sp. N2-109]|uniref:Cupin domain-containing protein n=1 Tax=Streptomyces gossypii TaxID=2883101 RepID=A0ABT2JQY6_9ACTN|nr:cupin domain-containing protein [Streptomyces gossypii]MCT2590295.1 cupin domain-containing protein [Streptomyces gossypii]
MSLGLPPVHVPVEGGSAVHLVGDTYTTLLDSGQTGGEFSLIEAIMPADAGPPPHTHHGESETFIVMEGELVITAGDDSYEVAPGGVVYVPKGVRHSFRNLSRTTPARIYFLYAPAGMDGMFAEIGSPGTRGVVGPPLNDADVQAMTALAGKYNYTFD